MARSCIGQRPELRHAAGAVAAAVLLATTGSSCTEPPAEEGPRAKTPEVSTADIKQARWRVTTLPIGSVGQVTRADKKHLKAQRPRLTRLVKNVYDSLFLFPSRKKAVLNKYFARPAARKVLSSRAGVSPRAERVRTWSRRASIGVQPNSAAVAAAKVFVYAKGRLGAKVFRLAHRATLWLQRSKRDWKVVGFDVSQTPVKKDRGGGTREKEGKRKNEKRGQKRGSSKERKHRS